jgi:type VI secretion system protein ImpL
MKTFFARIVRSRWLTTLLGVLLLGLVVWFFGPLLAVGITRPLETEFARGGVIGACLLAWLVWNLTHVWHARKRDKALVDGVAAEQVDPSEAASAEEVALLGGRLREALHALKRAKLGGRSGRYLYQLPWYLFIGPPGAGKTTALTNCGLRFPLADTFGPGAMRGVGGTRNCDWWFTDQAVMIDTAGRYTTQDSDARVDGAGWLGFLRLLKQHRRRQPLNGVVVAIGLADLAALDEDARHAHARTIRRRVRELHDQLGVRVPIYAVFTKTDLIAGFVEFFDNLGKEEREQVWGMTFPLDEAADEAGAVAQFGPEFDRLLMRLNDRMLERVHQEPDVERRRLIYGFPQQMASLREVAREFLDEIFRPSRLEARPLLRGVYFTSGTQDGTPIDRLLGVMAGRFGLSRQAVTAFSDAGRSYFLTRLVREVMFGEAALVGLDRKVERRQRWTWIGAYATAAAVLLSLTGVWTASYFGNRLMIAEAHETVQHYQGQYAELTRRGAQDTDLTAILPALETLRTARGGYADRTEATPVALTFGLYQGAKLGAASIDAYDRALNGLLLPRLLARLEEQMRTHLQQPDFLYQALKVYLILGRQGPLDAALVEQWMAADFAASFPGDEAAEAREALARHVHAMLEYKLEPVALDGPLVAQVRGILTRQPLAEYTYNRLVRSSVVQSLPEWTVLDNAGPAGARVFELRDGKALNTGVPGIFTWNGYHTVLLPLLPQVTKDASEDGWVLGRPPVKLSESISQLNQLRRDILGLYLDDYARRWDALLANVALKSFGEIAQGLDELYLLSAPESPLRDLLQAVDTETQLSRPAATEKATSEVEAKAAKVGKSVGGFAGYLARSGLTFQQNEAVSIIAQSFGTAPGGKPVDPAQRVDQHFQALHDFVAGAEGKPAQLEAAIGKIAQVYQGLSQAANAPNQGAALLGMVAGQGNANAGGGGGGGGGGAVGAAAQLQELSQSLPKPVAAMLQTVSQSSAAVTANGASTELSDAWRSKVLPLCRAAFDRYPFVAKSTQDVPLDDFVRLLGPSGLTDQFFDQYLKPFVDTSQTPWQWQSADHTRLNLSPATLVTFQRAADIRDALFAAGGSQIGTKFQLVPETLDPGLASVSLEVGGRRVSYAHGPTEATSLQWPAADGNTLVRLTMTPADGKPATIVENNGPWSLLHVLDNAHVTPSDQPDKFRVTFTAPAGTASFALNASSVRNPFTLAALRTFRCPSNL